MVGLRRFSSLGAVILAVHDSAGAVPSHPPLERRALMLALLCMMNGCDGRPPSGGGGAEARQAVAIFQNYPSDTYPQTSFHTAKVCDVVAVRIEYQPPLPAGTAAHISLDTFGGATAELGQAVPPLQEIHQNAVGDGSLGFGFHFLGGRPPGSADIVIAVTGRPTQRITVRIIP